MLVEIVNATEAFYDGRIYVELINGPFLKEGARRISARSCCR